MTLRIDVVRHGAAEPSHPEGDRSRRLTPAGLDTLAALGRSLARDGWRPEVVCSSPYARAMASARRVIEAAGCTPPVESLAELEPERDCEELTHVLAARLTGVHHALIVGHQPLLGRLVEFWTGRVAEFRPGDMVTVEFEGALGPRRGRRRDPAC